MSNILNIGDEPVFDDRIFKIETHMYNPFANITFGHSDEIRRPIQQQDVYTLPWQNILYVEGTLTLQGRVEGAARAEAGMTLENTCVAFMFDEIRYELDGVEIDRNRNVGMISTLKNYISLSLDEGMILNNAAWNTYQPDGDFNYCVSLSMLLGVCEDYKRIVITLLTS